MHKCDTKNKKKKREKRRRNLNSCRSAHEQKKDKRLQVAFTHAHAYMWAPVPQGSQVYFLYLKVLYLPDVTIGHVTREVAAFDVTNQSRCLEPEV